VIFSGLIGAIAWDLITWWFGLPTSSSHALIGGMAGAAVAGAGWAALIGTGLRKIGVFIVLAPLMGLALGVTLMIIVLWAFHRVKRLTLLNLGFRRLQLVSAAAYSLGHGANDAQKTMGVILALLIAQGLVGPKQAIPLWVVLASHTAMGLGTLAGGWRIVHTMGSRITHLQPLGGFCAEGAGAATLFFTGYAGIPVSTTHTIAGSIIGTGAVRRLSAVRWGVAQRVVLAWILTIPGAFGIAWVTQMVLRPFR
jgi:PiT family inorganic phosphate transporter